LTSNYPEKLLALQSIISEIQSKRSHVWTLLTDPKEISFWAPNVRDLVYEPKDKLAVDTIRHFRLDVAGKIETLDTRITHFLDGEMLAETPIGGSMNVQDKVKHMKIVFRVTEVDESSCSISFTLDYEMKGLMAKLFEKVTIGTLTAQYRIWLDRLKTYAETGRPV
jgi:hypothetical protein